MNKDDNIHIEKSQGQTNAQIKWKTHLIINIIYNHAEIDITLSLKSLEQFLLA